MLRLSRLNHAVLFVRDLERSVAFYRDVLGLTPVARMGDDMAFLRAPGSPNTTTSGSPPSEPARLRPRAAASGCTIWPGKSPRSKISPRPMPRSPAPMPSAGRATTVRQNRCTDATPTATNLKSCGPCRALPGGRATLRRPSRDGSTSPPSSSASAPATAGAGAPLTPACTPTRRTAPRSNQRARPSAGRRRSRRSRASGHLR